MMNRNNDKRFAVISGLMMLAFAVMLGISGVLMILGKGWFGPPYIHEPVTAIVMAVLLATIGVWLLVKRNMRLLSDRKEE